MSSTEQGMSGHKSNVGAMGGSISPQYNQFMNIVFTVSGSTTGPQVTINLASKNAGFPIAFTTGNADDLSNGLMVSMNTPGALPISQVNVLPQSLVFQTASSGGGNQWSFQLQCFLAGESGLQNFTLAANTDPSVTISASLNGGASTPVTKTPALFQWKPLQS
ncbi:hypothetical protein [Dyella subtropica]|uniref:hypothetical protein n=1 Tax=Dyella subtropica TaxID=2992127 RepID=UPI00225301BA|nr:hypothetical protein [Dyella subtropica]